MPLQPPFDLRSLVRGVIVQDQVNLQIGRNLRVYCLEELDPFLVPVPLRAMGQHLSLQIVQSRKQRQGSMPIVVMGTRGNVPLAQGKSRLATFQGMALACSSQQSTTACCGGDRYKPTISQNFCSNCWSLESLKRVW